MRLVADAEHRVNLPTMARPFGSPAAEETR